jgi:hypothetical protein
MSKGGLAQHVGSCPARREAIEVANQKQGRRQPLYHLRVQDAWGGYYWLHLEMNASAKLADLDYYLRAIWLECCGHLSQFSVGGWRGEEIPMSMRVRDVFELGVELTHIYDFGTSSETLVKALRVREGRPLTSHPTVLMARNNPCDMQCQLCEQQATYLCIECDHETGEVGWFCDQHGEEHEQVHDWGLMPRVNSPRVGMCGYDGPADPPY